MKVFFGNKRGGSCLFILIILALVATLIIVIGRLNMAEKQLEETAQSEEQKTPEQLRRDSINEMLSDKAPDLGIDPSKALVDGNIKTMKAVRDHAVKQQATIRSRLKNAEESFERLRKERKQLELKLEKLKDEFNRFPDDENVGDDLAQCDEDLEGKKREVLQAQANVNLLKDYDYRMGREVAVLSNAIRRCEADGRTIATSSEYESLKNELAASHGALIEIGELRRNIDGKAMDLQVGVSGEKAEKRKRLEKYRKKTVNE